MKTFTGSSSKHHFQILNVFVSCKYYFLLVEMLLLLLVKNGLILKEKERGNHSLKGRIRVRGGQELTIENTSASWHIVTVQCGVWWWCGGSLQPAAVAAVAQPSPEQLHQHSTNTNTGHGAVRRTTTTTAATAATTWELGWAWACSSPWWCSGWQVSGSGGYLSI